MSVRLPTPFSYKRCKRILAGIVLVLLVEFGIHLYIENQVNRVKQDLQSSYHLVTAVHQALDQTTQSKQRHFDAFSDFVSQSQFSPEIIYQLTEARMHFDNLLALESEPARHAASSRGSAETIREDAYVDALSKTANAVNVLQASIDQHVSEKAHQLSNVANLILLLLILTALGTVLVFWRMNVAMREVLGAPIENIHKLLYRIDRVNYSTGGNERAEIEGSIYARLVELQDKLFRHEAENTLLEDSLRETVLLLNQAERLAALGSWTLDLASDKLIWSEEIFRIFEVDPEQFSPSYQAFLDVIHPLDRDMVNESYTKSLNEGAPYDITHRLLMPDGRIKWVHERGVSDYDADGLAIRSRGTVQDVTDLKNAEDQLRVAAVAFESKEGIVITDAQGAILKINQAFSDITGYSALDAVGQKMSFLKSNLHDNDFYEVMWRDILRDGEWRGEVWNRVLSGEVRLHSVVINAVKDGRNNISHYVGTYLDVTDKRRAEDQLRIAAITFETQEAIMITDADVNIIRVNRAFEKLTGYQQAEVIGRNPRILNSGRHEELFYEQMWQTLLAQGVWIGDVWDKRKDGSIYPKQLTITIVKNEAGETTNYVGMFLDISDRKNAEAALRQSESYLTNILNSLDEVVWTATAPEYQLHHINAATEKIYGVSSQAFMDDPEFWLKVIHPDDQSKAKKMVEDTLLNGKASIEYRIIHANGQERWLSDRRYLLDGEVGEPAELLGITYDVTERKLIEQARDERQAHLLSMLQASPVAVCIAALSGRKVLFANNRYAKMINCAPDQAIGRDPKSYYANPKDYEDVLEQLAAGDVVEDRLINLLIPDVEPMWVMASYFLIDYDGEQAVLGWFYDVTDLRETQEALRLSEEHLKRSLDELKHQKFALDKHAIVAVTDVQGRITYANEKFCEISGYSYDELIGQDHALLNSGYHPKGFFKEMYKTVSRGKAWHGQVCNRAKDGHLYWVDTTISPFMGANGKPESYISTRTDITQGKLAEERSTYLALYDALTGLPNRRLLTDRLGQALASSARSGKEGALLFLDLDHFKILNDTLGHDVGDLLLQQVAKRLTSSVREGDTVARLGGDEFIIILQELSEQNVEAAKQVEVIGNKIISVLNSPYQLGTHEYLIGTSIGVALFGSHEAGIDELLKQADIAMYQAKKLGRNHLSFFDPEMQSAIYERVEMELQLRKAIESQQLHLYYQMQVDAAGRTVGAEALIRWISPERGMVSPLDFIPVAEETGVILEIGQWVLDTACKQLSAWKQDAATSHLTLSINVSAKQYRQPDFAERVRESIRRHDIHPTRLKLELTESTLLDRIDETVETMNILRDIGIRFSLDDFGTGYSSLQYLKRLPLFQLKIDRSFVRDIAVDSSDQAIVRTIVAMAHTLNLSVIAEGVETKEQQSLLESNGCSYYQGYLFAKPLPIEQFEELLKAMKN